jgi:hypothetical protein
LIEELEDFNTELIAVLVEHRIRGFLLLLSSTIFFTCSFFREEEEEEGRKGRACSGIHSSNGECSFLFYGKVKAVGSKLKHVFHNLLLEDAHSKHEIDILM